MVLKLAPEAASQGPSRRAMAQPYREVDWCGHDRDDGHPEHGLALASRLPQGFSVLVEMLNLRVRKKAVPPVELRERRP